MNKIENGLVHIYFGDGRGKTSVALGTAMRALGQGLKVYMVQFLKMGKWKSGELEAAKKFRFFRLVRLKQTHPMFSSARIVRKNSVGLTKDALDTVRILMRQRKYDLFILDEVLNVISEGFGRTKDLKELIKAKPENVELILTGRDAESAIIKLADYVSHIKEVKHPFRRGILARKGIEY